MHALSVALSILLFSPLPRLFFQFISISDIMIGKLYDVEMYCSKFNSERKGSKQMWKVSYKNLSGKRGCLIQEHIYNFIKKSIPNTD